MSDFTEECLATGSPWLGQEAGLIPNSKRDFIRRRRGSIVVLGGVATGPTEADLITAGDGSLFGTLLENAAIITELRGLNAAESAGEMTSEEKSERLAQLRERMNN